MIRLAQESDFDHCIDNECVLRIHALKNTYGLDASFIRYYADDHGNLLSLMDGTAVYSSPSISEEWLLFLSMNSEIQHFHCSAAVGRQLLALGWRGREGAVLEYTGQDPTLPQSVCENPYLPSVYDLLTECFDKLPSFQAWYPDASHRLRHNCAKIACIIDNDMVASTAMTIAEAGDHVLLGYVATHPEYRGRGYAKTCISSLISRCKAKKLYILPKNDFARIMYERMGFSACGDWAELSRILED